MDCKPKYLWNKIPPLMNSKMPKGQPMIDLFKVSPYYYTNECHQDLKTSNFAIASSNVLELL
jgi:hypothetical protein